MYGGPQLSQQNQKSHGKNKIPHGKTENLTAKAKPYGKNKNLTAKPKSSRQKQNTSRQNQNPHSKTKDLTAKPNTSQQKPNTLTVKYLVLPWGFWFFCEVFCFCCEVFGFAVTVALKENGGY